MFLSFANLVFGGIFAATPELSLNNPAPLFSGTLHDGSSFSLADRKGKGWTVLYFYPKADTPGCTKQACAFRDALDQIRVLNAEVYGVSTDSVESQKKFHEKYHLTFPLIADMDGSIVATYGSKMPAMNISKRWTFLIDSDLTLRWIEKDVDPALDAQRIAAKIKELEGNTTTP